MQKITQTQAMRYNRQISIPGIDLEGQEKWLNASALIVGVGGLGCAAAHNLVGAGVGNIILLDDDKVESHNLHRQLLHAESDVGRYKVDSAKESLLASNAACNIQVLKKRLEDQALSELIQKVDIVLDCTDNLQTRKQINRLCWQNNTPLVSGAAIRLEGQLLCVLPAAKSACYECFCQLFPEPVLSCSEAGVLPPVVTVVGAMQAMEALKILINMQIRLAGNLLMFDFRSSEWRHFSIARNPQCRVCAASE